LERNLLIDHSNDQLVNLGAHHLRVVVDLAEVVHFVKRNDDLRLWLSLLGVYFILFYLFKPSLSFSNEKITLCLDVFFLRPFLPY